LTKKLINAIRQITKKQFLIISFTLTGIEQMKSKKPQPLIAITCSRVTGGAWGLYSLGHFMDYTFADYSLALRDAGAAPLIVPAAQDEESLKRILSAVQGLVLSGGPDVHPRFYGEEPAAGLGEVDDTLDSMELTAARIAFETDIPVLGICRGIQVLNVALGGTLYQDISSQVSDCICHTPKIDKAVPTHKVRVSAGSRLRSIMGRSEIWVNGKHHQAVRNPAPGLIITARANDGVAEALEHPKRRWMIGVQWHPEGTWREDLYSKKLFRAFVRAACD